MTYNKRDCGGVFQVHIKKGIVKFKPTPKGLHALNLKANPEAAFLFVNDSDLHFPEQEHQHYVATVRENYDGFTRKQIEGATAACCVMGMMATPSTHVFQALVCLNL